MAFAENEVEEIEPDNCPVLVDTTEGKRKWTAPAATEDSDFIIDEKSQILSIVDFKSVPRNEGARQQARRELVIQMLIAESMTNWKQLNRRVKQETRAKRREERLRNRLSASASSGSSGTAGSSSTSTSFSRSLLSTSNSFNLSDKLSIINDFSFSNYKWKLPHNSALRHCVGRGHVGGSRSTLRESVCSSTSDLHIWLLQTTTHSAAAKNFCNKKIFNIFLLLLEILKQTVCTITMSR